MKRGRSYLLIFLLTLPLLVFLGVASWTLWSNGKLLWIWFLWPVCWLVAYLLARMWRTDLLPVKPPSFDSASHWTPRDEQAWEVVRQRAAEVENHAPRELTEIQFYVDCAQQLAIDVARCYHPKASDPLSSVTVPEILAAAELALEDLAGLVEKYLPAGHLLTIKHWKTLSSLPERYDKLAPLGWAISTIFSPAATAGRYALSKSVLSPLGKIMQSNLLTWFYLTFIQRVGFYMVEMNSGRLRGGAAEFRRAFRDGLKTTLPEIDPEEGGSLDSLTSSPVTLCVVGQAGSGKTSLIQCLVHESLPEHRAAEEEQVDEKLTRYQFQLESHAAPLTILDSEGYGTSGLNKSQRKSIRHAFQEADLVLLTINATNPARDADADFLAEMSAWYEEQPTLKPPAVLGVLTHIDLLSPVREWSPPYNWETPSTAKSHTIRDALQYNEEVLAQYLAAIIPVCSGGDRGAGYGIEEWLIPAMLQVMPQALGSSLVRNLEKTLGENQTQKVFEQLWNTGRQLVKAGLPGLFQKKK